MKEREIREQMEKELRIKEQQLADITKSQKELELRLLHTNLNEAETKNDNDRLQKVCFEFPSLFVNKSIVYPTGKDSVRTTITADRSRFRRFEAVYLTIANPNEKRET